MVVGRTVKIVVLLWGCVAGEKIVVLLWWRCVAGGKIVLLWGWRCVAGGKIVVEMRCWGKNCGVVVVGLRFVLSKILQCCYTHAKTRLAHL